MLLLVRDKASAEDSDGASERVEDDERKGLRQNGDGVRWLAVTARSDFARVIGCGVLRMVDKRDHPPFEPAFAGSTAARKEKRPPPLGEAKSSASFGSGARRGVHDFDV